MPTRTLNGVTFTYSHTTESTKVTIVIENISVSNSATFSESTATGRKFSVKIDGSSIVSVTSDKIDSKTTDSAKLNIRKKAVNEALTKFSEKVTSQNNKKVINRTYIDKTAVIDFNVFGKKTKVTIAVNADLNQTSEDPNKKEYTTIVNASKNTSKKPYLINNTALDNDTLSPYERFGWIERIVDFDGIDDPDVLYELGLLYLKYSQFEDMSLTVSALDLHLLDPSISEFKLLDNVRCLSYPHGMDKYFPITAINIPLDQPDRVTYTMGTKNVSAMSSSTSTDGKDFLASIRNLPSQTNLLDAAKAQMTIMMNNKRVTGYVNIIQESETSQAIIISDNADWTAANNLWKWDMNGLAFSDSTIKNSSQAQAYHNAHPSVSVLNADDRWYKVGITNDGTIVADFIHTGILTDGQGKNYWNLSTGEFSLAYNTSIRFGDNTTKTVGNVYDLAYQADETASTASENAITANTTANSAKTTANSAKSTATTALNKAKSVSYNQPGITNLLNGTLKFPLASKANQNPSWSNKKYKWIKKTVGDDNFKKAKVTIKNLAETARPINSITKAVSITTGSSSKTTDYVGICQYDVPVVRNTTYTASLYVRGYGTIHILVGKTVKNGNKDKANYARANTTIKTISTYSTSITNGTSWKTFNMVFQTASKNDEYQSNKAGIYNNKTNVIFAVGKNSKIEFCGLMLVRGNCVLEYQPSVRDTNEWAENYTDAISKSDREFSKAQRQALDQSLNQKKIFNRLTNNGRNAGIYLKGNKLYINGTYIKSGTIDAGIIKSGILIDNKKKNKWNLVKGYLQTTNMVAKNIQATGTFDSGTGYVIMRLKNGEILGYHNKKLAGWINAVDGAGRFRIAAKDLLSIQSRRIQVVNSGSRSQFGGEEGITGWYDVVLRLDGQGGGYQGQVRIVNGLVTCWSR